MSLVDWVHGVLVPAARENLEQVAGIKIRKASRREWRAPCPIHRGDDPNWSINSESLRWKCHSHCGGGDIVKLWACIHGMDPHEKLRGSAWLSTVKDLASNLGLEVPDRTSQAHSWSRSESGRISEPTRAPSEHVAEFWESLAPFSESREAIAWAVSRGLDHRLVGKLCRYWPADVPGPSWAGWESADGRWHAWRESGNAIVFPTYTPSGELADCRFRSVTPSASSWPPKSAGTSGGLVLANGLMQKILQSGLSGEAHRIVVCEGEPDYASWASDTEHDAVLGLVSGSVTNALASQIPVKSVVCFDAHSDEAGLGYMKEFSHALAARGVTGCVAVQRSRNE